MLPLASQNLSRIVRELDQLAVIRSRESRLVASHLLPQSRVLELGAGTGAQARELRQAGFDVVAIDVPQSDYASSRVAPVIDYDGHHIPFEDGTFDVVYSSNVLEHIPDLQSAFAEIVRVLRPGGYCIHVLPTHTWRFWQTLASYPFAALSFFRLAPSLFPRALAWSESKRIAGVADTILRRCGRLCLPRRHGERGNTITELAYFHPIWWRSTFRRHRFEILHEEPGRLFYTGHVMFGSLIPMRWRERLSRVLGSSVRLYVIRPRRPHVGPFPGGG